MGAPRPVKLKDLGNRVLHFHTEQAVRLITGAVTRHDEDVDLMWAIWHLEQRRMQLEDIRACAPKTQEQS